MAPRKHLAKAAIVIILVLSLHLHPIIAHRGVLDIRTEDERSDAAVESETLAQMFRVEKEETEALVGAEAEKFCGMGYSTTMRRFYFELDVVGKERNEVRHFAAELVRAPLAPRLVMHAGRTWSARLTEDSDSPIDWVLTPLPNSADASYGIQIDFLYEVHYIRNKGEDGIEIKFNNGTSLEFVGGLYYPEKILAYSLQRNVKRGRSTQANLQKSESAGGFAVAEGGGVLRDTIAQHGGRFATRGALGGVAVGFGLSYGFNSAIILMNGILNQFLTHVGAAATLQISVTVAPLTAAQILTFTSTAGSIGLAGGLAIGLGAGLVLGIPAGVATAIRHWIKQHKELKLTASEKIYAKLNCHRHFKRCGWGKNLLVPDTRRCPK